MRIAHCSDTHGRFLPIKEKCIDVIVHSGDFHPDPPWEKGCKKEVVAAWQKQWVEDNIEMLKSWVFGRPLRFCSGNHNQQNGFDLEEQLKSHGIDAACLDDKLVSFQGVSFYGFPYIDFVSGWHAYEMEDDREMQEKLDLMIEAANASYIDCLVIHQPPWKILDKDLRNGLHWGNKLLNDALFRDIKKEMRPQWAFIGHCHSARGITIEQDIVFVNSATTYHIIDGV
jgi:Icc-related predicted phosphoesterase